MPQITLVSSAVDYDLYERLVAQAAGTTTVQTAAQILASILSRTCQCRNIKYPNIAPNNTGSTLIVKDANGNELTRMGLDDAYLVNSGDGANKIPLLGILLRSDVNNALVDIEVEVA